jgi:phosphoadenosine phosphosulfate reductase
MLASPVAPDRPSDAELDDTDARLGKAAPQDVLRWAVERFPGKLLMATAFGAEGCCLIHMLAEVGRNTTLINLDTGYQFPETLALRDRLHQRYGLTVELVRPEASVEQYEAEHGGPLYVHRPDQCCHDRKVRPLARALAEYAPHAWVSAVRRDQTENRASTARVVQWDAKFGLVKVNPLLNWTKKDVWKFVTTHDVPYNPLHDQGYPSIGCWPCTRPTQPGEDDRAGRWAGKVKKECGLHVVEVKDGAGI